jgi:hypothetical protein
VVVGDSWSKPETTFDAALSSPECQGAGQQAICKLGTLDSGVITFLNIVLDVNSLTLDPLIDVASVLSRQKDPTPKDNRADSRTTIR